MSATKKITDRVLLVEFSGWCTIDAKDTKFLSLETDAEINGEEWLQLSEEGRGNYILTSVIDVQSNALDGCYEHIDVEENCE